MAYLEVLIILSAVAFFLLMFCTAIFEKHPLHQYTPVDREALPKPSPYFKAVNESAQMLGFTFAGAFRQARGSRMYQATLALWVSSDGTTMAQIFGGTTAGIPLKKTILVSLMDNGRLVESIDQFGSSELSGLTDRQVLMNAQFDELLNFHNDRLAKQVAPPRQLSAANAFQLQEAFAAMRADQMEKLGLARYGDAGRTFWRYTMKGALRLYSGFQKQKKESFKQKERIRLKRPGAA